MNKSVKKITTSLLAVSISAFVLMSLLGLPNVVYSEGQSSLFDGRLRGVQHIASSQSGVSFSLLTPDIKVSADGQIYAQHLVHRSNIVGQPNLPYFKTSVVVPQSGQISAALSFENIVMRADTDILPIPLQEMPNGFDINVGGAELDRVVNRYQPNPEIYTSDKLFPDVRYELSEPYFLRGSRLVDITIYPLRYAPQTGKLTQARNIEVEVTFGDNIRTTTQANNFHSASYIATVQQMVINPEHVALWQAPSRSARSSGSVPNNGLPVGQTAFKIEVDDSRIYEITRAELLAAGMDPSADPRTIEMMHYGESVAYELVNDDGDGAFDIDEVVRFYGWEYDQSRMERQFVTNNVFWLWIDGTPDTMTQSTAVTYTNVVTTHEANIMAEIDDVFSSTRIYLWDQLENEPDSFYWIELFRNRNQQAVTETVDFILPYPPATGPDAIFTYEIMVEDRTFLGQARMKLNDYAETVTHDAPSKTSIDITHTVPITAVNAYTNSLRIENIAFEFTLSSPHTFLLNHITADYLAKLTAYQDQILFKNAADGQFDFEINGLSTADPNEIIVWDISNRHQPIGLTAIDTGQGGTVRFGHDQAGAEVANFVVAGPDAIGNVSSISSYEVADIAPAGDGAQWVAIAASEFVPAGQSLAAHRATFSNLSTHVVNATDIYNQYGHGFASPLAIQAYMQAIYDGWATQPQYLTLIGDAHFNPRQLPCGGCNEGGSRVNWQTSQSSFLPANYAFVDRFQGLVPSDHEYSLLAGDDLLSEIAVGRLSVETTAEAQNAVDKIIRYEENLAIPAAWHEEILFVHDWPDDYEFDIQVSGTLPYIPTELDIKILGLSEEPIGNSDPDLIALRNNMFNEMLATGLVNWRGHGTVHRWSSASIFSTDDVFGTLPNNVDIPMVSISMDCLDGNFIYPEWDSLSESLLRMDQYRGSAAHWSSTGLGFPEEHLELAKHFYNGLYDMGMLAIGDAINYSKSQYTLSGFDKSEVYAFTLQGDPAMVLYQPDLALTSDVSSAEVSIGESASIDVSINNGSPYAASNSSVLTVSIPAGLSYISYTTSLDAQVVGPNGPENELTVLLPSGIPSDTISTITFHVLAVESGNYTSNQALFSPGVDLATSVDIMIAGGKTYLPYISYEASQSR